MKISVPIIGPKQYSFLSEVTSVLLLSNGLCPHKRSRVSSFVIRITNTYPIKYKQKPATMIELIKINFLNHFVYHLPIIIVLALPILASLTAPNISVEI